MTQEHRRTWSGYRKAICSCGYVAEADASAGANRKLIRHILHPSAANKVADTPQDHANCTLEQWSTRWSICEEHSCYVDTQPVQVDGQTEMSFT